MIPSRATNLPPGRLAAWGAVGFAALVLLAACDLPFGLGLPTTHALESGAADALDSAKGFRLTGSYSEAGTVWSVDMQVVRPFTEHLMLSGGGVDLEAIIIGPDGYFRGQKFLSEHMGSDPVSRAEVQAAGDAWWRGSALAPQLPDFTKGGQMAATLLGSAVTSRTDHASVGGIDAAELSGVRADVFIAEAEPHRLLRVHLKPGAVIDGIAAADFRYSDYGHSDFGIVAPANPINFSDLSTLPPIYTVASVDTSSCGSPCAVSATVRNLGGTHGAKAPSAVTFTMTDPQSGAAVGACTATIQPDVAHGSTAVVSCTIAGVNGADHNAAVVSASATNPGHV